MGEMGGMGLGEDDTDGSEVRDRSPYNRAKDKMHHGINKLKDKATKELEHNKHIGRAYDATTEIVPSENIDRLKDLTMESVEVETGCSWTMVIVLGAISVFVPNGYLLYNFAGVIVVDMVRQSSKIYLIAHTLAVNLVFMFGIVGVAVASSTAKLPEQHLIQDPVEQAKFVLGMNISLAILGVLSFLAAVLHWTISVSKLYEPQDNVDPI